MRASIERCLRRKYKLAALPCGPSIANCLWSLLNPKSVQAQRGPQIRAVPAPLKRHESATAQAMN